MAYKFWADVDWEKIKKNFCRPAADPEFIKRPYFLVAPIVPNIVSMENFQSDMSKFRGNIDVGKQYL